MRDQLDLGILRDLVDGLRISPEIAAGEKRDAPTVRGQLRRALKAGIAAADDRHVLAVIERAVTGRAIGQAFIVVLLGAGHVELAAARAGGDEQGLGFVCLTLVGRDHKSSSSLGDFCDELTLLDIDDIASVRLQVLFELLGQVQAGDLDLADPILDALGDGALAIPVLGDEDGLQSLARGIDAGCHAGRSAAQYREIIGHSVVIVAWSAGLQKIC